MSDNLLIIDATGNTPTLNGVPMTAAEIADKTGVDLTMTPVASPEILSATVVTTQKRGVAYRLGDGTIKPRGKGRPPIGSVLIAADGTPVGDVVVSKAKVAVKAPTAPNFILMPDGTIKARNRGRLAKGAVIVSGPTGPIPEGFRPTCQLVGQDGNVFNVIGLVAKTLARVSEAKAKDFREQAVKADSYGAVLVLASKFVEIE